MGRREEWNKRDLYQKFAEICLSEKEYSLLEERGIIPRNLGELYRGETNKHVALAGGWVDNIAKCGVKLFLEDSGKQFGNDTAMFFFADYVVVFAEPNFKTTIYGNVPDVLPVAIPINTIQKYRSSKNAYDYSIYFRFDKKNSYEAYTMKIRDGIPFPHNMSYFVNARLLGGWSINKSGLDKNQKKITDRLDLIIQNCCKDYDKREKAIFTLFSNDNVIAMLQPTIYLDKMSFLEELEKKISFISDKDFPEVIKALNSWKESIVNIQREIEDLEAEKERKNTEYESASFFTKSKLKREVERLTEQLENTNRVLLDKCDLALSVIMQAAKDIIPQISCGEQYGVPEEYVSLAEEVCSLCKEKFVAKLETEDEKLIFSMICKQKNVPQEYQNNNFFNCGMYVFQMKYNKEHLEKMRKSQIKRIALHNDEKDRANIVGADKYTKKAMREHEIASAMARATQLLGELAKIQSKTQATKSDSAILGGLANGIAGPAMGMATYARVEAQNARAEAAAAETRAVARENLARANSLELGYTSAASGYSWEVKTIYEKLCDTVNTEKYFSYLDCKVTSYKIAEDGTMTIHVRVDCLKNAEINGIEMVMDGSLCIYIKEGDKIVGTAYICAPGFDETNLKHVGFRAEKNYEAIGISELSGFSNQKEYSFEIRPVNIWVIEK